MERLRDLLPAVDDLLKKQQETPTRAFPTWKVQNGELYSVVAMTNQGKTFWTWGTALTMAREGRKVGIISTEDSLKQIRKWVDIPADDGVFDNVWFAYVEDVSSEELRALIGKFAEEVDILFIDYLRADVLRSYSGDLFATMSQLYKVLRGALEAHDIAIIQTIQANSTPYKSSIRELLSKSQSQLYSSIDGGPQTAKRSLLVCWLVVNNRGERGLYMLKAKGEHHKMEGKIWKYGRVSDTFRIEYESVPLSVDGFFDEKAPIGNQSARTRRIGS